MKVRLIEWRAALPLLSDSFQKDIIAGYNTVSVEGFGGNELLIEVEGELVGVVGLEVVPLIPAHIIPTAFILPQFKGLGITGLVHKLLANNFKALDVPFGILVKEWDEDFLKSTRETFASVVPLLIEDEEDEGEAHWWWDLSAIEQDSVEVLDSLAERKDDFLDILEEGQ